MPTFALRQTLAALIGRIEIDMETKAAEVQLMERLDQKLFLGALGGPEAMRLVGISASSASCQTHPSLVIDLGMASCEYTRMQGEVCCECRRSRNAA